MVLFTEAYNVVRTDAGPSKSFEVKVASRVKKGMEIRVEGRRLVRRKTKKSMWNQILQK